MSQESAVLDTNAAFQDSKQIISSDHEAINCDRPTVRPGEARIKTE